MSINRTIISGNLTRDPELRETKAGVPVLSFTIAFNDRVKQENGQTLEYPNYIDCALFGTSAKNIHPYLHKAQHVCADGKLRYNEFEQNGSKRSKLELIVNEIDFSGTAQKSEN